MRTAKYTSLIFLFFSWVALQAQTPGTTFYGVEAQEVCWTTSGGIDSTIYQVSLSSAQNTRPTQMFFYTPIVGTNKVQAVTVSGGSIKAGHCFNKVQLNDNDTIINKLDILVELLGGGTDTCQVTNEWRVENLTSNQTYVTNTYNSIAIQAVSGTITISVDSAPAVTIQNGSVVTVRADACRYVQSSVAIGVTSGSAIVSRYY